MLFEAFTAVLQLGLPVAVLTAIVLRPLYASQELDREQDAKTLNASLKALGKARKKNKQANANLIEAKWWQFGGGFYGAAALWTFVVLELNEIVDLVTNFPPLATLLQKGIIGLVVSILVNQIQNLVQALVWFTYWTDAGVGVAVWMGIAYAGFLAGTALAKHVSRSP